MLPEGDSRTMRAVSFSIAALLLGTAILVFATAVTFASTLSTDPRSVATLAVLSLAVLVAAAFGIRAAEWRRTPYW